MLNDYDFLSCYNHSITRLFGGDKMTWNNIGDLHRHAKKAVNQPIKALIKDETIKKYYDTPSNKGWIGNSIESDWFGLANNSRKEADFSDLGVELKVTPIRKTKNGWSAKERLVLNIFDFHDEHTRKFESASFLEKSNLIELMYYEFIEGIPSPELYIKAATLFNLHNLPKEDLFIIRQDWHLIINKIKEGKAEELSDSLTKYLGATTKGSKTDKNMTTQPFSDKKAHRRSFTLKGSYMTEVARKIMAGNYEEVIPNSYDTDLSVADAVDVYEATYTSSERVIKNIEELKFLTFEEIILKQFKPFIGQSKKTLGKKFDVKIPEKNDKASSAIIAKKMLNLSGPIQDTEEFKKAGISVKVVTVDSKQLKKISAKRKTTEGFKLQNYFNFEEIIHEKWEDSQLYNYLSTTQFLLIVFEKTNNDQIFKGATFWHMNLNDLDGLVFETWTRTLNILKTGVELTYKSDKSKKGYSISNNFPSIKDNTILHVRPDSKYSSYKKSSDSLKLPSPSIWMNRPNELTSQLTNEYMTKQAFWLNSNYMYQQVRSLFE